LDLTVCEFLYGEGLVIPVMQLQAVPYVGESNTLPASAVWGSGVKAQSTVDNAYQKH
jgi:hypothetical protein